MPDRLAGTIERCAPDVPDLGDPYRVWDAVLKDDDGVSWNIHVGGWFVGALHPQQRLDVSGRWEEHTSTTSYLDILTLTDLDTNASFSRDGKRLGVRDVEVSGSSTNVFDLALPASEGTSRIVGYCFDVCTDDGLRTVVMRGSTRKGPPLFGEVGVRVSGTEDSAGVIHSQKLEYESGAVLRVLAARPWVKYLGVALSVLVGAGMAFTPWIWGFADDMGPFAYLWAAIYLSPLVVIPVGSALACRWWG